MFISFGVLFAFITCVVPLGLHMLALRVFKRHRRLARWAVPLLSALFLCGVLLDSVRQTHYDPDPLPLLGPVFCLTVLLVWEGLLWLATYTAKKSNP